MSNFICIFRFVDAHAGTVAAIATIVIAAFTILLWRSTHKLWKAAERQREDFRDSIKAAIRSADAAEKAAEALPAVERAYLFVSVIGYTGKSDIRGTEIFIEFHNHGKTPAIMKQIYVDMVFGGNCPREIDKVHCNLLRSGKVIGAGMAEREKVFFEFSKLVGKEIPYFAQAPTVGHAPVDTIVYGIIEYKDVFNEKLVHIHRFCWHRNPVGHFESCGNEEVNYCE